MTLFEEFFKAATGHPPYGYQSRLAREGLPAVVQAPTGSGKTGVILAWLWRWRQDPEATPRRLIYALPQRTLVEQVAGEVERWLGNLGDRAGVVTSHVVMGGEGRTQPEWRLNMHQPAIVVGTIDSLVSKALNRGYGISRAIYPIDFALVTNGAHWIIDEIQLAPESTTTLRQLAAFTQRYGTAEPFGLTCMSATVPEKLLATVDNPVRVGDVVRIEPEDRTGALEIRLKAARTIRRLPVEPGTYPDVAAAVWERHRPGALTLVVVNTVPAARGIYAALPRAEVPRTLLHSRFRGAERRKLVDQVIGELDEAGRIVVSTQVVEAGMDLNAAVMVTEAAPWPSLVQRAGRCNRTGEVPEAHLWWLPPAKPAPYEEADVEASTAELSGLEGAEMTGEDLLAREVYTTDPEVSVIRRTDLLTLFDTAPDLTGADLDVAPYVRDADDLDVQLAWATWTPAHDDGRPPDQAKAPTVQWRCRVPIGELKDLLKRATAWRFDQAAGRWSKVSGTAPPRPGEVLVMSAGDGGYDPETGFDPSVKRPVPDCPSLDEPPDLRRAASPAAGAEDSYPQDDGSVAQPQWLTLDQHSHDVRRHAEALLAAIRPRLPGGVAEAVVRAGYAHDAGKVHEIWQEALCRLAGADGYAQRMADRPWAKSAVQGRLRYRDGVAFRHELVSMLLLDGPLRGLLSGIGDPDLVRYLVLAHHGKLRMQVRAPGELEEDRLLGLAAGETLRVHDLLGQSGEMTVDLEQFTYGGERSWTRTALALRDRYGPFLLAYLEALVRIADWRASAEEEEAR